MKRIHELPTKTRKIEILQVMRGIAAIGIVFFHCEYGPWESANWGVSLFFVLSGYLMMRSKNISGGGYWRNRLIRICPLYYTMTLVVIVGYHIMPGVFRSTIVNGETIIKSVLFLPCGARLGHIFPIYSIGWTINLEMFFYAVFYISSKIDHKHRGAIVSVILAVLVCAGKIFQPQNVMLQFWTSLDLCSFLVGIGIYALEKSVDEIRMSVPISLIGIFLSLVLLFSNSYILGSKSTIWEIFWSGVILLCCLGIKDIRCNRFFVHLGDMSYSIYMTHFLVVGVICRLIMKSKEITVVNTILVVLCIVIAIACSEVMYQIFEVRIAKLLKGQFNGARRGSAIQ